MHHNIYYHFGLLLGDQKKHSVYKLHIRKIKWKALTYTVKGEETHYRLYPETHT